MEEAVRSGSGDGGEGYHYAYVNYAIGDKPLGEVYGFNEGRLE